MPLNRAVAFPRAVILLAFLAQAVPVAQAQQTDDQVGDPERGKVVYRSIGYCVNCHGWPGDGKTGLLLQAPAGPSLRESQLDTAALIETIGCGRPGTQMPFHDRAAYRDDRCFGLVMSDFDPGTGPRRGKTFSDKDVLNVVAYLQKYVIGRGEPTFEECAEFYDNPSARACDSMK